MILDLIYILIILITVFLGFKRGFVKEAFNLIKFLIVIYLTPLFLNDVVLKFVRIDINVAINRYLGYFLSFLLLYIVLTLSISIVSKLIDKSSLGTFNKILGLVFGIIKSSIIIFLVFIIVLISSSYNKNIKEVLNDSVISEYISIYLYPYNSIFPKYLKDKLDDFRYESRVKQFKKSILNDIIGG